MNADVTQRSATIYQFPARGRMIGAPRRDETKANANLPQFSDVVSGGNWYHEAAVREAEKARKP
ncbi:MAG: DUF2735 domain-containing protein [Mesorhizobium sp.]|nr:DUF2735 domain-containing protein [Mesorhizobium sp.]